MFKFPVFLKVIVLTALALALISCGSHLGEISFSAQISEASDESMVIPRMPGTNVLVFSKTEGFRHSSIESAVELLQATATERKWNIVFTEDSTLFVGDYLANFDVVVFLLTSGDVLDSEQQAEFEKFIQRGGGYAGVHSASDTEYDWPWYGDLVGAYFNGHPEIQTADIVSNDSTHLSTSFLPCRWSMQDEWYNFRTNPAEKSDVQVLLWLDESTYAGGTMGDRHPIAWYQTYDGGRSWYTAAGHRAELYTDEENELFQRHLIAGVEWAAGKDSHTLRQAGPINMTPSAYLPLITIGDCTP